MNASKEKYGPERAAELLRQHSKLVVAKGKKVQEIDLGKTELPEEELLKLVLGPTGNLRAPTWRRGKTLVVGFNPDAYDSVLGS